MGIKQKKKLSLVWKLAILIGLVWTVGIWGLGLLGISVASYRLNNEEKRREIIIAQLQEAFAEVKQLSGLLPICSSCKKIRDDKGYWTQIESYIRDHSEAEFSHSICPDCAKQLYPDIDLNDDKKDK
jgi:hypothetical protein